GGWMARHPIPPEWPQWGRFLELLESNMERLREILERHAAAAAAPGSNAQKLGDFWASGMDTKAIAQAGAQPLAPELERINALAGADDLPELLADLHLLGMGVFFDFRSTQDYQDSTQVIGEVATAGLGLPDRDYYLREDERSKAIQGEYLTHLGKMFALLEQPADAERVMRLETDLAKATPTNVDRRDPEKTWHPVDPAGLSAMTPHFSWERYFKRLAAPELHRINVEHPEFLAAFDRAITGTPLDELKLYLRWHLINSTARYLSPAFEEQNFHFKGRVLTGAEVNRPRWKRVVMEAEGCLGEALGQAYVEKYFSAEAKAYMLEMVGNLREALREDLQRLPWMGAATRRNAEAKLDAFVAKIGYPDVWRDYSSLSIDRGPWVRNVLRSRVFESRRDLAKIGKPVDRTEWHMTPATVNAYYHPQMNEIVFPAGILQPPFFNPAADDAINYGAIGAVIGHEMTHGFDDQGAKFDAHGNMQDWWTAEDLANFEFRGKRIETQFDGYEIESGLHVNGALVKGEAIADLGGVVLAWAAFQRALGKHGTPPAVDGFTPQQRFFLGFAQVWAANLRPEYLRLMVHTDPHPPGHFRVNGTLANVPAFAEAFGLQAGDPMVLTTDKRTEIW
ncbi:MAG: M13 family metallopeptidase, partial [Candidatus Xenobia bacterium]